MFRIGCHLSIAEGYFKALQNILSIGGNTYQYFSRNPQGGKAKAFNQMDFDRFIACAKDNQVETLQVKRKMLGNLLLFALKRI